MPTPEQRAKRAAAKCSPGGASNSRNVNAILDEIVAHGDEQIESCLDEIYNVELSIEKTKKRIAALKKSRG